MLVTSYGDRNVRRLLIDENGNLTDTGDVLSLGGGPHNVFCGADGASGVVVMGSGGGSVRRSRLGVPPCAPNHESHPY